MKKIIFLLPFLFGTHLFSQSTVIGTTGYDLQTNACSKNRMRVYDDGKVSVIWTGSDMTDGAWADRGMYFNHYNGISWGAFPTDRIEAMRTGFGEILTVAGREVVISHYAGLGPNIKLYRNAGIGSTVWTELPTSGLVSGMWPSAYCPEGTNDIYLVTTNSSTPTAINFSRSDNGGNSWSVLSSPLPFLTNAEGIDNLTAEVYPIAVHGNDVYILYGATGTDLKLLHSPNKGNPGTWEQTILVDFPIDNYNGELGEISDINGDGVADTVETTDQAHEMIITDDGTVHIWSGLYLLLDWNAGAEGWSYFPRTPGMWYWNSTMTDPTYIDLLIDWDNTDGLNDPFAGIGASMTMYDGVSFTSMAGAAYDETTGYLYVLYTMPIEYTDYFGDPTVSEAQSFRDIFGVYSDDNGATWSTPVNLTNTAESFNENVFVFPYDKVVDGKIYAMWMQDEEPGTSLDVNGFDPYTMNNIRVQTFTAEDFGVPPPCDIISPPTGLFADNITPTTVKLHWNAVAGADKYQVIVTNVADPLDKFKKKPASNVTNIAGLTPGATYGFKVKTICPGGASSPYSPNSFFTTPLKIGDATQFVSVYPNPSNGNFTLSFEKDITSEEEIAITVFNSTGQMVYATNVVMDDTVFQQMIPLEHQPAGIYLLKVSSPSGVTDIKVVVE